MPSSRAASAASVLVAGEVAGQPLDVLIAGDDADAKEAVKGLVESGGSRIIDAGPLRRAQELERLGFLGLYATIFALLGWALFEYVVED